MRPRRPVLALLFAALTTHCELEAPGLDAGATCRPDASVEGTLGDIDNPTSCQEVCNAAGRLCTDEITPPCYQQAGGALIQYESIEFIQSCAERIAPTFQSAEGRLSLSSITCFCQ